ncbi:coiled-coil domain containing 92Bb [Chanos chanos]|uniref:Coiled-coil domain containing 92Bb n=1 Tax=Chanos chanos TaxID=29144 RepID=A0A6J2W4B4_CHACN|nr:coiled-coil domain-containing protein 92-like [Chanos chanos]
MESSSLAQQVESAESNIAFLQQEHRVLLTGLRLEIRHLKKRCNELTCELNDRLPARSRADVELEEEMLQARLREAEDQLEEQDCVLVALRAEVRQKGILASSLQVKLREEERRFLDELKRRSHKITALGHELRKQNDTAAQLSFHSAHFRLYRYHNEEEENEVSQVWRLYNNCLCSATQTPTSPVVAEASHAGRISAKKMRSERVRECVPRERVLGPEEPRPMPDPTLFLSAYRHRLLSRHRSLTGRREEGERVEGLEGRRRRRRNLLLIEEAGTETTEL